MFSQMKSLPSYDPFLRTAWPKFVLTINCKIFKNSIILLQNFVEMSQFYQNIQWSKKLFSKILNWSSFYKFCFFLYIFFNFEILNFLFITFFSTSCFKQIYINLENRLNFLSWSLFYLVTDGWTDGHPRIREVLTVTCPNMYFFTKIGKSEDEHENIMPSHSMGRS